MITVKRRPILLAFVIALSVVGCTSPSEEDADPSTEATAPVDEDDAEKNEKGRPSVDVDTVHPNIPKRACDPSCH